MRIDFHVHSKFSKRPSQWFLQKLSCPESFTEPSQIYETAKKKGMSLVTISDHNCIDGVLEIADLPDVFISEEVTTYFPDDGCKLHVLAVDINESQHVEIQKTRGNLFDLVAYLNSQGIFHALAHPLYDINDRLTVEHFEKCLLLFRYFEINGTRDGLLNRCLEHILIHLAPADIERIQKKHDFCACFPEPWKKRLIGGSDDHSGLNIARTHTQIEGAGCIRSALRAIEHGDHSIASRPSTPQTLAHNLYGIAYQFYRKKLNLGRFSGKDILINFLDRSLAPDAIEENGLMSKLYFLWRNRSYRREREKIPQTPLGILCHETRQAIADNPDFSRAMKKGNESDMLPEKRWFDIVNLVSNKALSHFGDHLLDHMSGANLFNMFQSIGSAGGLYTLLSPYFVSFSHFSKNRRFGKNVLNAFDKNTESQDDNPFKVAHFTDTFYDINGVALSLQQQVQVAIRNHKHLTVVTCDTENRANRKGVQNFTPIGTYVLPEYPELKIFYPPLLEMLDYCYEQNFTQIHSATPGPIGLAGLAVARILKLPINGTYHTALPEYAQILTGDEVVEEVMWRFILWYYDQMDFIYVPSKSTGAELTEKGIRPEKIRVFPRGIDIEHFHPAKRNGCLKERCQINEKLVLLYVGRVSKEKNLDHLCRAFKCLTTVYRDIHLVVVGDGPFLEEMKADLNNEPVTFTGYLDGEDLASVYASSDLFVFPSATDTFGNVVLEAQASGLPVIVTDSGGPQENIIPEKTGVIFPAGDTEALLKAIEGFIERPERIIRMGKAARTYMEERSFDGAFIKMWKMYKELRTEKQGKWLRAV